MTRWFFYKSLVDELLIKKISEQYEINDGIIFVEDYGDSQMGTLRISDDSFKNKKALLGKMVTFKYMSLNDVLTAIHTMRESHIPGKVAYTVDTIQTISGSVKTQTCYIIY